MEALIAGIVGAAIGAMVSVALQYLGYNLAVKQDRRNQRRQRLTDAITEAGSALYGIPQPERMGDEEFTAWKASLPADSLAAQRPALHYDLGPFHDAVGRAMWTLDLHLGKDHWLKKAYLDAVVKCAAAEEAKSKHFRSQDVDWRITNIPALDKVAGEARDARDEWMRLAREEVERI